MALTPSTRIGPYEVTAQIGVGGMGEVYRATDTTLGRPVAIKVLPEAVAKDPERIARFEREARTLAQLNHPNIAAIYGLERNGDIPALVMELVEGPTLSDRIAEGALPIDEALPVARQIVAALEAAHQQGIIHRDLKPANVKVRADGTVKVLDFGLAKLQVVSAAADAPTVLGTTQPGILLGTPAYMSPEQASGKAVDARSDIFSFGAVVYEMLAGRRAFEGDSTVSVLAAILRDEPPPLQSHSKVAEVVTRCLSKSPGHRFQTMADVKASLSDLTSADRSPAIAVLPFVNMSDDKAQEYFSDGLAEEIINALVQIPGLKVTARTSAFAFRGKEQDIPTIAAALRVGAVLEGSVRKSGTRLRVTAQLIDAASGYHLWSQRYDRELADVFEVQDEIAAAIASALRLKLGTTPADRRRHQPNLPAYEAFLKGRHLIFASTLESNERAKDAFAEAVALDPEYAEAHAELANWYFVFAAIGARRPEETMPAARAHAMRAVEHNPGEPRAHAVLGAIAALYERNWDGARERFHLALKAEQVPPEVRFRYALFYLVPLNRFPEALNQLERAVEQDPLNVIFRGMFATILLSKSLDDAAVQARQAIDIDRGHFLPYYALSMYHFCRGELREARQLAERSCEAARGRQLPPAGLLAGVLRRLGEHEAADALVSRFTSSPSMMAIYHLICLEIDAAADAFANAVAQGEVQPLMWFATADFLSPLRSSPRWSALAKTLNLAPDTTSN